MSFGHSGLGELSSWGCVKTFRQFAISSLDWLLHWVRCFKFSAIKPCRFSEWAVSTTAKAPKPRRVLAPTPPKVSQPQRAASTSSVRFSVRSPTFTFCSGLSHVSFSLKVIFSLSAVRLLTSFSSSPCRRGKAT